MPAPRSTAIPVCRLATSVPIVTPEPVRIGPDAELGDLGRIALAAGRPEVEHRGGPLRDAGPF